MSLKKNMRIGLTVLFSFLIVGLLAFAIAPVPVLAQEEPPVQPPPEQPEPAITVVVPETGGQQTDNTTNANWILWLVIGLVIIILLVALLARGRPTDI